MPDSEVVRVMRQFKADLLRKERAQMTEMAQRWQAVERRMSSEMAALALEMTEIKRDGGTVSQDLLFNQVRYRELLGQLTDELETYTEYAERTIEDRQRQLARLGINHAESAIKTQGVTAGFNRLPVEAVTHLVGMSGNGTPLRNLLVASWPSAAQGMTQELINGVALGYNPRKTARMMAQGAQGSQKRMEVIARTEQLRVYRSASLESYRTSQVVRGYRRLATHDRRVCAACLMDEGHFYELDEEMPEHPQGRCAMIPAVEGAPAVTWKQGPEWFEEQSADVQKDILGKERYYRWQNGDYELKDLVTVKPNATWGPSLQVTPLTELTGANVVAPVIQATPIIAPPAIPVPQPMATGTREPINLALNQAEEKLSVSKITEYIVNNSLTSLDVSALREQVQNAAPFNVFGKTRVKLSDLIIQDLNDVVAQLGDGSKLSNNPIVVDNFGFIIDGRHRAALAIRNGQETISAYAPIMRKS